MRTLFSLLSLVAVSGLAAAHDPFVLGVDTDADGSDDVYVVEWHDDSGVWVESNDCEGVQGVGHQEVPAECNGEDTHAVVVPELH